MSEILLFYELTIASGWNMLYVLIGSISSKAGITLSIYGNNFQVIYGN